MSLSFIYLRIFNCLIVCMLWLVIWFQNSSLYHFSMFHASHHITPVPATEVEVITFGSHFMFSVAFLLSRYFLYL